MNKQDLIRETALNAFVNQDTAKQVIDGFLKAISDGLASGEEVKIIGFGTFSVKHKKGRIGRNPKTGEEIAIPRKTVASFKAGVNLTAAAGKSTHLNQKG